MNISVRHFTVMMALLMLSSGAALGQGRSTPSGYSPHYTVLPFFSKGGKSSEIIMPEACLSDNRRGEDLPGCANAFNLQRMVEREEDLIYGRKLDPAIAAPAARAALRYMYGWNDPWLGGGMREVNKEHGGTLTEE